MSKRYVLVNLIGESPLTKEAFETELGNSVEKLFGDYGLAHIEPKVVRFDPSKSTAIVACNKMATQELEAAIGLISEGDIIALTAGVSGTIKGLRRKQRF